MKKTRRAHLWIGLIASILILMESITGLLMNEPWLIGQSQVEGNRGNFQPGQFNQGTAPQGTSQTSGQTSGQSNASGQTQSSGQSNANGQTKGQTGTNSNGQFPGQGGPGAGGTSQGSFMSTIKSLHQGKIGNTDVKWLTDLAAIAMIFLTGSGIYLSIKVLGADRKRKKRKTDGLVV